MLTPGETFSKTYPASPEAVAEARNALTGFASAAGVDRERLDAIRLAASEAITNAVMHAYLDRAPGDIQVSASYLENELWLLVSDGGKGLHPRTNSPGLGLGLALIAQLADDFQILSRGSGGTELRLRFNLPRAGRCSDRDLDGSQHRSQRQSAASERAPRGSVSAAFSPA